MRAGIDATICDHRNLIDALGGPTEVAEIINRMCRTEIKPNTVSMMRTRKIPWCYRNALVVVAKERDIEIPNGFLGYQIAA